MGTSFAQLSDTNFLPDPSENVLDSIFQQYERVIVESLITSFGLDFFIKDQHGGDVDTIHNVRQIDHDNYEQSEMKYKNSANKAAYENRGEYSSKDYHANDSRYTQKRKEYAEQKKEGTLYDGYTKAKFDTDDKVDVEHIISAKEIHNDAGRVLAGLTGTDLANSDDNLCATNAHTNRSKQDKSMDEFLNKEGGGYTEEEKANMRAQDARARKAYNAKINKAYYTSPKFAKDVAFAAGTVGMQMGLRQALGFVFTEIWFSVKDSIRTLPNNATMELFLRKAGNGIKQGFENARLKYKMLLEKFKEGAISGILSSVVTTLCNIFFTTAKNVVKILRQTWASLVQAGKILLFNPDNLPFGERIRSATKIIATGASVVLGTIVSEALAKTPLGTLPVVGPFVSTFCGTLTTGILSCTLLYYLDRGASICKLFDKLNQFSLFSSVSRDFAQQAAFFEAYAAELLKIDLTKFKQETAMYADLASAITQATNEFELNHMLLAVSNSLGIKIPWEGDFNEFMQNKNKTLVFE